MSEMETLRRFSTHIAAIIIVFTLALLLVGIYYLGTRPKVLYPGEVTNYQGENLSSITDVRENAIKGTQFLNSSTYRLKITGLVNHTVEYSYNELLSNFSKYQKAVTLHCVEGWSATILWEGFLVTDLINDAGVNSSAVGVIFYASDGYSTELPLDYINNNSILMAYKMNDVVIPPERGFPFELVAESQYGYKWIKWVTQIELTDDPNYLGFWESRGYPNNATVR
jgi:DMSO/TMAO reductase YedYZ molybdopterin-dependent catalytic subunit